MGLLRVGILGSFQKLCVVSCLGVLVLATGCDEGAEQGGTTATDSPQTIVLTCPGAVYPTIQTIESGEYAPLSRPLFIYVNKAKLSKPEVAGYVDFMMSAGQALVPEVGYIKLNPQILAEEQTKLAAALNGAKTEGGKGIVSVDGSSTVFPVSVGAAEEYQKLTKDQVKVVVGKSGTGGGFKKFCVGETDISNASRAISQKEIDLCEKNGVEYLELKVCIDGLSVVVHPENDWCTCLSVEDLKKLWEPDAPKNGIKKWSDLNPAWPQEDIKLYGADTDSGTFDYFTEAICGKGGASRSDYSPSTEDNVLVRGVAGDKYALGYFGYAYFDQNKGQLRAVAIKPAAKSAEKK